MKLNAVIILVTVLLCFVWANTVQAGLGISPSRWIEKNTLKGSHLEKVFTLSRSNPDQDLYFKTEIEGEIKDWLKIDKGIEFTMPKGEQQFPIRITLDIPQDTDYKSYQGSIRLKSEIKEKENSGMGAGTILASLIQISLTVVEKEVSEYEILQIRIPALEKDKPINVYLKIWNKGNIEAKPTKLTLDFWDKYKQELLESKKITDFSGIKPVAPFSEGEIKIEIPNEFETGQYWAEVKVYQDAKLLKSDWMIFDVLAAGSAKKEVNQDVPVEKTTLRNNKINLLYFLIGVGIFILAGGIGFAIRKLLKSGLKLEIKIKQRKRAKKSKSEKKGKIKRLL